MERNFEKQLCPGSGIAYLILLFMISLPNGFVLFVLVKNPLRCPRRGFSVFLLFICAMDLFVGVLVSSGEVLTRFLCAFSTGRKNGFASNLPSTNMMQNYVCPRANL